MSTTTQVGKLQMLQEPSRATRKQSWETSPPAGGLKDNFLSEVAFEFASKVR